MVEKIPQKTLCLLLFLASLTIHGLGAWNLPLVDRDEPRFAEASREMLESGDFLVPRFNHKERYDKPPLFYWCQAASYRVSGQNDFAARFPSCLAAALTSLLIFGFGSRLYGRKTGFWAAVLFTTSAQTLVLAKAGVADMLFAFFYTIAVWSAWEVSQQKKRSGWILFCVGLALGFLTKGPLAFLPLLSLFIFAKLTKTKLDKPLLLSSMLGSLFLIGLWAVPALIKTQGAYFDIGFGKHVLERSLRPFEGHGAKDTFWYVVTLPFYFMTFFVSFLPWSWRAPQMIRLARSKPAGPKTTFLFCQLLCVFAVFSLLRTKLPHYTFPAFPVLSILWAHVWTRESLPERRLALGAGFMIAVNLILSLAVFPRISGYSVSKSLAQKSAPYLTPDMALVSVDYNEPSLVWYFRKYLDAWHEPLNEKEASFFIKQKGPKVCIVRSANTTKIFGALDPSWKIATASGFNPAKGKREDLTLIIKEG